MHYSASSIMGMLSIMFYFILFSNATYYNAGKILNIFLGALSVVLSIIGIVQIFKTNAFPPAGISTPFDNPAGYSTALACLSPYLFFCGKRNRRIKYLYLLPFVIILSNGMRSAILAICFCAVILLRNQLFTNYKKALIVVSALIGGFIFLYFLKQDSANGRLLIWLCSIRLILDNPVEGYGPYGFDTHYMLKQADYFQTHTDSPYSMLADDVNNPFNEYISLLINFGIIGSMALSCIIGYIGYLAKKRWSPDKLPYLLSLLSIAITAFFSYPFNYVFFKIMVAYNVANLIHPQKTVCNQPLVYAKRTLAIICCFSALYFSLTGLCNYQWKRVMDKSFLWSDDKVFCEYEKIKNVLGDDAYFLYNYAATLYAKGEFHRSMDVIVQSEKYKVDYDFMMLKATVSDKLGNYDSALYALEMAHLMCPAKFKPLFHSYMIYKKLGNRNKCEALKREIIGKEIKVESKEVQEMIKAVREDKLQKHNF